MHTGGESPILRRAATVRRADALFQAMSHDFLLRQQFITNPTQVLSEYMYGTQLPSERTSAGNQLVYAVLSDRKLLTWLHGYAEEHVGNVPSGRQFVNAFAHAVADLGARHVVAALIRSSAEGNGLVGFHEDLLHFFINLRAFVSDGGDGGTPDTEVAAPEASVTGTLTAITWKTWLITRPQLDSDERFSAGQPREFAPRYVMVTLNELAQYAAELRKTGALDLPSDTHGVA